MCLTSPATVVSVEERGGVLLVSVLDPDEGCRECITYVDGLVPGDRVRIAGGAIVERLGDEPDPPPSLGKLLIEAFEATKRTEGIPT